MAKRIDPVTAWAAYEVGISTVRSWLDDLPEQAWAQPSVLPGWDVTDLAAHLATVSASVTVLAAAPSDAHAGTASDYLASYAAVADEIADTARELADDGDREPAAVLARIDEQRAAAAEVVERIGLHDQVVTTRRVPVRLGDYLLTRVVEIAVHADDLARSVPDVTAPALPRDTVRMAARALLDVLAERAPGRSVEVRVPPFAAVQCVEGPRHTRGTPANVVELTSASWLRLAAGRTSWEDEVAAGNVSASGDRADLSGLLPLL
ncbi:uncharacterized protein (TIGR03083 family) [Haloactinopolyspora alba]|uniref:Uncharacterized protein (TIGR03083 family) n=1 Tax=Haloactinopolyspora alba TaxID=648780 RepID=A0A2P8EFN3_9ACTN|nr:sterol carrier family protein [Haloactinopolyspora alba]PSL08279.1 uncharacterized protein (TIGR03083 family) [Haloactinopolyspora alba]